MSAIWEECKDLQIIAENLINKLPEFEGTIRKYNPSIKFLSKSSKKSKELGKCSKSVGFWKYLAEYDYVIWTWKEWWDEASAIEKEALTFHELKHIHCEEDEETGEIKFKIAPHEIEAFVEEVAIYKDWRIELSEMKKAFDA